MITIFTVPRPFIGHFNVIQRNAVESWKRLRPEPEILLFGEGEEGAAQAAADLKVPIFPVARSDERGRPLITDALHQAQKMARHDILCMANADNIYMSDLPPAIQFIASQFEQFLIIGQRWNLKVTEILEFQDGWEEDLRRRALAQDDVEHPGAVDYLIWRGDFYHNLPPLAVGQKGYDWLLVWLANQAEVPTVDATQAVMVIHQDHPPTFQTEEMVLNDQLIIERYGDGVRGGTTQSRYRLFLDHLLDRHEERRIPWKR